MKKSEFEDYLKQGDPEYQNNSESFQEFLYSMFEKPVKVRGRINLPESLKCKEEIELKQEHAETFGEYAFRKRFGEITKGFYETIADKKEGEEDIKLAKSIFDAKPKSIAEFMKTELHLTQEQFKMLKKEMIEELPRDVAGIAGYYSPIDCHGLPVKTRNDRTYPPELFNAVSNGKIKVVIEPAYPAAIHEEDKHFSPMHGLPGQITTGKKPLEDFLDDIDSLADAFKDHIKTETYNTKKDYLESSTDNKHLYHPNQRFSTGNSDSPWKINSIKEFEQTILMKKIEPVEYIKCKLVVVNTGGLTEGDEVEIVNCKNPFHSNGEAIELNGMRGIVTRFLTGHILVDIHGKELMFYIDELKKIESFKQPRPDERFFNQEFEDIAGVILPNVNPGVNIIMENKCNE